MNIFKDSNLNKVIFHIDCNNFFANIELLKYPHLLDKAVAIAGDPSKRHGIILAKNSLAKQFGVTTAETIIEAKSKCPNLIILPANMWKYKMISAKINYIYKFFSHTIENFSIDEAFLDVSNSWHLFAESPYELAILLKDRIYKETSCQVTIGISDNKNLSKIASDFKNEGGVSILNYSQLASYANLPIEKILSVGNRTKCKLSSYNIRNIYELTNTDNIYLESLLGKNGLNLKNIISQHNNHVINTYTSPDNKSINASQTFPYDIQSLEEVKTACIHILNKVIKQLKYNRQLAQTIAVSIRFSDFQEIQQQYTLQYGSNVYEILYRHTIEIITKLLKNSLERKSIRKIGISLSKLTKINQNTRQINLESLANSKIEQNNKSKESIEELINTLQNNYGSNTLFWANQMKKL